MSEFTTHGWYVVRAVTHELFAHLLGLSSGSCVSLESGFRRTGCTLDSTPLMIPSLTY